MASGFEDPYLTCPLDEVHRIRKSRMQCHLTKCLKNHKLMDKIKCPFNPLHIIYPNEMTYHMTVCESNASVAVQRYDRNDQKCFSGVISEKEAMAQLEAAFGSFSNEVEYKHTIDTPAYDPIRANIDNPLFRTLNCESKSKRKEFRLTERKRIAAIEAEQGKKKIESTQEDRPMRELKPIRSQSVLAAYANDDDSFPQCDHPTVNNYALPQGIMCENEEKKLEVLTNGYTEIQNGTGNETIGENALNLVGSFDQLLVNDDFEDIAKKLELLSRKESEILGQRRELMEKLSERATKKRITSESLLEKISNESASENLSKINSHDLMINKSIQSLTSERAFVPVEAKIDVKSAGVKANNLPTPAFKLSSYLQSSAWNVVTKGKSSSVNTSTASKITTSKRAEVPVDHPIVQPVAQLAVQTSSIEENPPIIPSSEWTTVSRSRKGSNFVDSSTRKPTIKSRESSPVRETSWHKATALKEILSSEPPSTSFDIKMEPRDPSPVHEALSWRKEAVPKEIQSTLKLTSLNNVNSREVSPIREATPWNKVAASKETSSTLKLTPCNSVNSREASPAREATPWNKVATFKETSRTSESQPLTVLIRSKKVSSSQQYTQWKLAPEALDTSIVTPLSPKNMTASLKTSEAQQLILSDKDTKLDENLPASVSCWIDKPKPRPVFKDSSQKGTLVPTTTKSSTVSSTYCTTAKTARDKFSENPVISLKTHVSANGFLPIPRRSKITSLFDSQNLNRLVAPGAGRGILHAVDEIRLQKKNDITSRRLRPGSASSFCSSFDQVDIEGVYGYEEIV